jgi:hypothetical protein
VTDQESFNPDGTESILRNATVKLQGGRTGDIESSCTSLSVDGYCILPLGLYIFHSPYHPFVLSLSFFFLSLSFFFLSLSFFFLSLSLSLFRSLSLSLSFSLSLSLSLSLFLPLSLPLSISLSPFLSLSLSLSFFLSLRQF